eukprot:371786-Amphidinium_carterae.1
MKAAWLQRDVSLLYEILRTCLAPTCATVVGVVQSLFPRQKLWRLCGKSACWVSSRHGFAEVQRLENGVRRTARRANLLLCQSGLLDVVAFDPLLFLSGHVIRKQDSAQER